MTDNVETPATDDWAAAMAEQATIDNAAAPAPARRAPTAAFEQFSPGGTKAAGTNDESARPQLELRLLFHSTPRSLLIDASSAGVNGYWSALRW